MPGETAASARKRLPRRERAGAVRPHDNCQRSVAATTQGWPPPKKPSPSSAAARAVAVGRHSGHFKAHLKEGMDKESWKTMLPGVRGSAQVAEMKDSMKVLDALQADELRQGATVEGRQLDARRARVGAVAELLC